MRFYVVADRYEYPDGPPRSIEVCPFLSAKHSNVFIDQ